MKGWRVVAMTEPENPHIIVGLPVPSVELMEQILSMAGRNEKG
jgi:hypothetical protein